MDLSINVAFSAHKPWSQPGPFGPGLLQASPIFSLHLKAECNPQRDMHTCSSQPQLGSVDPLQLV